MNTALQFLRESADVASLEAALRSVCAHIGDIDRLHIAVASQGGKRQALCFLRMSSPEQEHLAMLEFGAGRAGDEVVLVVDLPSQDCTECFGSASAERLFSAGPSEFI